MNEIVKYHNDLNKIQLPSFTEQEQNLLFGILSKVKEKKAGELISLYPKDLKNSVDKNLTSKELADIILVLKQKFFKADFTILLEKGELIGNATINLFQEMIIWCVKDDPYDGNDFSKNFSHIDLMLNPRFEYLLNDLLQNFTRFELAELIAINGKYTKTLYRLLKQYRQTGRLFLKWEEFLHLMDIPQTYRMCDIDIQILKPALKELSKERTLFDQTRIPFEKLSYTKIKDKGRGRGGKVIGIEFTFKPQKADKKLLESSIKSSNAEKMFETWDILQTYNFTSSAKSFENLGVFSVGSCERLSTHIEVDFIGENKKIKLKFENAEQLQNAIKGFTIYEN